MPCVNITDEEAKDIEKFHCPSCVISRGPSTYLRKSKRPRAQIDYEALNDGSTVPIKTVDKNHHYVGRILDGTFSFTKEKFARLSPEVVTMDALTSLRVWDEPIVIPGDSNPRPLPTEELKSESKEQVTEDVTLEKSRKFFNGVDRLGMRIPYGLTVEDVADLVGREHRMNVIDVQTQHQTQWPLGKWAEYYNSPDKDQIRNVISLEVSETKLGGLLKRPNVVEQLDLSDWAWPSGGKEARSAGLPTSVKLYCLMSVKDSYTDFHIDFGGSSVFYHIVRGKKTFFFIPPTDENLKAYEEWCNHPEQNYEWLAKDRLCYRVELSAGDTMLIPSGWIHAVYTPADSLVIGGNFLTRNHYVMQMKVHELERRTNVTARFRYPNFAKVHWYAAMRYMADDPIPPAAAESLYCGGISEKTASSSSGKIKYTKAELEGLPVVVSFLARNALIASGHISDGISKTTKANVAKAIPKSLLNFGYDFVKDFAIWVTWKRACGETIPVWARPGTAKGFGFPGVSEKNIQPLPTDRDENEIVEADRDAYFARFKRYASKTQRDVYTPSPEALPTILTTPRHAKEPRPRNSSKKRKEASDFDEDVMKEAVSRVSGHLALPKLTVLGPMKTACSTCSKKKVRCLHKDEVQKKQKEVHDLYQTILAERHSSTTPAYEQPPKKRRSSVSEIERTSKKARSVSIPESSAIKPKSSTVPPEPVGLDSVLMDDERAGPAAIPAGEMALEVIEEVEASPKPVVQPMVVVPVFPPPTAAERRTRTAKSTRLGGIVAKNGRKRACSTCRAVRRKCPHTPDGSGMVDEAELEKIGVNVQPIVRKVKSQAPVHREAEPLPPATVSTPVEVLEPRTAMQATTENPKEESFLPQLNGTDAAIEDDDSDRATSELTEIESDGSTFDGLDQRLSRDIPLIQVRSNNGLLLKFRFNKKKSAAIDLMETTSGKDATTLPPSSPNSRPDNRKSSISEHSEQRLEQSKTVSIPSTPRRADEKQLPMLLSPETRKGATATKRARASFSGALEEFIPQDIKRPRKERTASHGASNGMKRDSIGSLSAASLHDGDEFFEASKIQEFGLRRRSGGGK
ncbi:Clavaminate synthase-like protein [Ascobolus immersus RN42]|uniref:[histone H3]-dimethyl-L-lysine(36) demethylase n=1 Tax=Ascobolus immersus RN42 TaxID=1160509 RepID=A0A3N4IMR8_ASCIM|nr:Clavaminate synthase-like protein [Ascobolus immersus RN42]